MLIKNKKNVVFFLIPSTILLAVHYMCLNAWTGAVIACVELVFLILMYIIEIKSKLQYTIYLCLGTILVIIILSIITWDTWISVLPMMAIIIYLISMIFKNVIIVKSSVFIRIFLNGIYMLLLKSYFGAGLSILILVFTIVGLVKDVKRVKNFNQQKIN